MMKRTFGQFKMIGQVRPAIICLAVLVGIFIGRFLLSPPPVSASEGKEGDLLPGRRGVPVLEAADGTEHAVMTGSEAAMLALAENSSAATTKKVRDPRLTHLLDLELTYEATLRSCLSSYCFDELVSVAAGKKAARIGFLAPPSSGSDTLIRMLNVAARKDLLATATIENSTHVPAYGYGKNHGWTRIVRLVRRVIPHALSLLVPSGDASAASAVPAALFDLQVRQLVRWQCRLTHVAAHTKLLTVFLDDVLLRPMVEVDKILSFIGIRAARNDLLAAVGQFSKQLQSDLEMHGVDYNPSTHLSVGHLDVLPAHLVGPALAALESEMTSTDTLTRWPCKNFRDLEQDAALALPVKAKDLAADCSSPKVICSVGFDKNGG